jgi:hypothetical protein
LHPQAIVFLGNRGFVPDKVHAFLPVQPENLRLEFSARAVRRARFGDEEHVLAAQPQFPKEASLGLSQDPLGPVSPGRFARPSPRDYCVTAVQASILGMYNNDKMGTGNLSAGA